MFCLKLPLQAASPLPQNVMKKFEIKTPIRTAAVCVYPNRVPDCALAFKCLDMTDKINIASGIYNNIQL